jgi:hypothetical protein
MESTKFWFCGPAHSIFSVCHTPATQRSSNKKTGTDTNVLARTHNPLLSSLCDEHPTQKQPQTLVQPAKS